MIVLLAVTFYAGRLLWPVLAFAVALGFAMALTLRPPPNVQAPGAAEELRP
jgi:hypothetical protein